jgi:hypothetical protein
VTSSVQDSTGTDYDPRITRLGYAKIVSTDPGEGDGWALGQATTTTTPMGGASTWFNRSFGRSYGGRHRGNVPWYW